MSKCKAYTAKGTPCTRNAIHDKIPYCWQHARQKLEATLWGLDQEKDRDGDVSGDDLTPERVYEIFINALREQAADEACEEDYRQLEEEMEALQAELARLTELLEEQEEYEEGECPEGCVPVERMYTLVELFESCQDELAECQTQSNESLSAQLAECQASLAECQASLADAEEEIAELNRELDDCEAELNDQDLPGYDEDEEPSEEDSPEGGTFPGSWVPTNPIFVLDPVCPEVVTEEQLMSMEPHDSVAIYVCPTPSDSGKYINGNKYIIGESRTISVQGSGNHLHTHFFNNQQYTWDELAFGCWVKPGDWFFYKNNGDGMWYGNVIKTCKRPNEVGHPLKLSFEETPVLANFGEGTEFAIIIFAPQED